MEIHIGNIIDVLKKEKNQPLSSHIQKQKRERRKSKRDRRKSVRDGVIVNLSIKNDRRSGRDRRKGGV